MNHLSSYGEATQPFIDYGSILLFSCFMVMGNTKDNREDSLKKVKSVGDPFRTLIRIKISKEDILFAIGEIKRILIDKVIELYPGTNIEKVKSFQFNSLVDKYEDVHTLRGHEFRMDSDTSIRILKSAARFILSYLGLDQKINIDEKLHSR